MSIKSSIQMEFGEKMQDDFSLSIQQHNTNIDFPPHWHDCFEFIYLKEGSRGLIVSNKQYILNEGDIAIIPPHVMHGTNNPAKTNFYSMVFGYTEQLIYTPDISFSNIKYLNIFSNNIKQPEFYIINGDNENNKNLRYLLENCAKEVNGNSIVRELKIRMYILEIHSIIYIHALSKIHERENSLSYILNAQTYIENHLSSDISPYEIADILHISYSHLSRLFNQHLGMSMSEFICRSRLNLAERLLAAEPELSITECAARVGFNNVSYFISKFKHYKGCSPGSFRRSEMNLF